MAQSDGNFAELLKQSETRAVKALIPGEKISAVVASIDRDTIFLDVGAKSEGIVDAFEFVDETGTLTIAPGDSVEVFFLKVSSGQLLFYQTDRDRLRQRPLRRGLARRRPGCRDRQGRNKGWF